MKNSYLGWEEKFDLKMQKDKKNYFKDNRITRELEKWGQIETNRPEKLAKLINVNLSVPILVKPCELSPINHENMKIWKLFREPVKNYLADFVR